MGVHKGLCEERDHPWDPLVDPSLDLLQGESCVQDRTVGRQKKIREAEPQISTQYSHTDAYTYLSMVLFTRSKAVFSVGICIDKTFSELTEI